MSFFPGNCTYLLSSEYAQARSWRVIVTRCPRLPTVECRGRVDGNPGQDSCHNCLYSCSAALEWGEEWHPRNCRCVKFPGRNKQFIYSVYTKDTLNEKGQARDTRVHVHFNAPNWTKNRPVAGWNSRLLANWIGKKTFQKVRLTSKGLN